MHRVQRWRPVGVLLRSLRARAAVDRAQAAWLDRPVPRATGGNMNLYAILRRSGWKSPGDLEEAATRSRKVGDEEMPDEIRWIRSYVLEEGGGSVGTFCVYQA